MLHRILAFLQVLIVFSAFGAPAVYRPEDLANPNIADRRVYVADPAALIDAAARQRINQDLYSLRLQTGAEVMVAVVPSIGDMPIEDFSTDLFTRWGIGKSDRDNGVLMVVAVDDRQARIATGYGVEGIIPDITARKIINDKLVPFMKKGDVSGGIESASGEIAQILRDPNVREELKSNKKESWEEGAPNNEADPGDLIALAIFMAVVGFLVAMILYGYDSRRFGKMDPGSRARGWHERRGIYMALAFISLGLGLIPYLLSERKRKRSREMPHVCPSCKAQMHKLNEEEDNALLSASQDLEERLKTVDYDVWVCPQCGEVERVPFKQRQMVYQECPACHTVAMRQISDRTIRPATRRSSGTGERTYECRYCHHRKSERYTIPARGGDAAAAAAAGAVMGGLLRGGGRGHGGGGFGGGLGGGRTGGGGASGRW